MAISNNQANQPSTGINQTTNLILQMYLHTKIWLINSNRKCKKNPSKNSRKNPGSAGTASGKTKKTLLIATIAIKKQIRMAKNWDICKPSPKRQHQTLFRNGSSGQPHNKLIRFKIRLKNGNVNTAFPLICMIRLELGTTTLMIWHSTRLKNWEFSNITIAKTAELMHLINLEKSRSRFSIYHLTNALCACGKCRKIPIAAQIVDGQTQS